MQVVIDNLKNKGLSDSSIKLYLRNLKILNNGIEPKNLLFLKNIDNIINKLENYKENTKRGYLISIVSLLREAGEKFKPFYEKYRQLMIEKSDEIKQTPTDVKSDAQKKNWIEWDEVLNKYNELKEKVNLFSSNKQINEKDYNILLSFIVLSLYVILPPRRNEYTKTFIVKKNNNLDTNKNYLVLDDNIFILNQFKTAKKEGQKIIQIPDELRDNINIYLKFHPFIKLILSKKNNEPVPFLVNFKGQPINQINGITRILNRVFNKKISSSMLRHIYLSSKYNSVLEEQKKDSELMSHSLSTQKAYIKK